MANKPWEKKKQDTEELQWRALQIALAYGPLEPWEIPLTVFDDIVFGDNKRGLLGLQAYMEKYKAED